jgi:PKD repeat protein
MKTLGPLTSAVLLLLWFSPVVAQLPSANLSLWLRSDSGVVKTGNNIDEWHDVSGHNQVFYPTTTQPLFVDNVPSLADYPAIRFDGIANELNTDSLTDIGTVFILSSWNGGSTFPSYNGLINKKLPAAIKYLFLGDPGTTNFYTATLFGSNIYVNSNPGINYAPLAQYKVATGTAGSAVTGYDLVLGNNRFDPPTSYWNGDIAEVIIYNSILTSADRQLVENYLYNKYAPAVNLGPDIMAPDLCGVTLHAGSYFVSYNWNGGGPSTDSTFVVTSPGTYTVVATDIFGRTSTDAVVVTFPLNPFADSTLCAGDSIVWYSGLSSSQYTFLWSDNSTADSLLITDGGTYSVTVTNLAATCTFTSAPITVTLDSFPLIADLGGPYSLCSGNSIGLIAGAGSATNYLWGDNSTNPTLVITATGDYTLTVSDVHGCSVTDMAHVDITGTAPVAIFTYDTVCQGTAMHFTDASTYTSPDSIVAWSWNFGDTGPNNTDTNQNPTHIYSDASAHIVTLTVTSVGGCSATVTHTVQSLPIPVPNFTVSNSCVGNSAQFTNTSNVFGDPTPTWLWNFGDPGSGSGNTSTQQDTVHIYNTLGSYTVTLTVTTSGGCINSVSSTVVVNPVNFCFTPNQVSGLAVWLSGDNVVMGSGGVQQWNDSIGINDFDQSDTTKRPDYIASNPVLADKPCLRFNGTTDELNSHTLVGVGSVFILSNWNGAATFPQYNGIINLRNSPYYLFSGFIGTTNFYPGIFSGSLYSNSSLSSDYAPLSSYKVTSGIAGSVSTPDSLVVGNNRHDGNSFWNGDIAEVIIYNSILTSADRQLVENYLYNKYAPPVNLGPDIVMPNVCDTVLRAASHFTSYVWNGDTTDTTTSTITVTRPGTYSVVTRDIFGRTSTDAVTITYPLNQPPDSMLLCAGDTFVWNTGLDSTQYTFLWSTGDTTASLTITTAGTYFVTVTYAGTCTFVSDTLTVTVDSFPVIADIGGPYNLCSGNTIGLIAGADSAQTYLWNTSDTTATISIDTTGTYIVTVFDAHGCSVTDMAFVTIAGHAPIPAFIFDSLTCMGTAMQFTDQSLPFDTTDTLASWLWDFGDTASGALNTDTLQNPSHLYSDTASHIVILTVTTTGGCSAVIRDTVSVHPNPAASFNYTTACLGNPTQFNNTSTGSISWQWNFGDTSAVSNAQSPSHTFNYEGYYTVTLVASNSYGCMNTAQQVITVHDSSYCFTPNQLPGLQLWVAANSVDTVAGQVSQWLDMSGRNNHFTQGNTLKQPQYISSNPVLAGNPCLHFDGLNDQMASDSLAKIGTVFVLSNWSPSDTFPSYNGLLNKATIPDPSPYVLAGDPNLPKTSFYTTSNTVFGTNIFINSIYPLNYAPLRDYKVVTGFANGAITTDSLVVGNNRNDGSSFWNGDIAEVIVYDTVLTQPQRALVEQYLYHKYAPPANLGPDITATNVCPVILNPGGWFKSYKWQGDTAYHTPTFTATHVGQYFVEVTDIFGFTSTDTVNVTFPFQELPALNILCAGNTLPWNTLLDTSLRFQWLNMPDTTPYINITTEGYYGFTVTDNTLGCTFISDSVFVKVDSLPVIMAIGPASHDTTLCSGNTLSLLAGDGVTSYLWNDNSTDSFLVVMTTDTFSLHVTDSFGCTADDSVIVTVGGTAPTAIFSAQATCEGDPMLFTHTSIPNSGNIDSVLWDFGDTASGALNTSIQAAPSHLYSDTMAHLVRLTVFTDQGCQNYVSHWVQVVPKPDVAFTLSNACAGAPVNFFDNSLYFGSSALAWDWNFGDPGSGAFDTSSSANPVHTFNTDGNYFVSLIAYNTLGCHDTVYGQVVVNKTVAPVFTNSSTCFGSLMSFFSPTNPGTETVTWQWSFGDAGTSTIWPMTSHFYAAAGTYLVNLRATTGHNCISNSARNVTVNWNPVANFQNSISACLGSPYTFTDASTITAGSIVRWDWNVIGVVQFDSVYAPVYTFDTLNTYNVQLKVTSDAGCTNTVTKPITVRPLPVPGFMMTPPYGPPGSTISFMNASQNVSSNSYSWDFGDGNTATGLAPQHQYTDTGNFCVWMTATTIPYGCKDSVTDCIYIISPRLDIAVQDISAVASNNTLNISARIANLGTLDVNQILMKASLPDGTSIQELDDAGLQAGDAATFNFAAALTIPHSSNHDYYCVEAVIVDSVPSNNKRCESIVTDYSIVEPYPNPFTQSINLDVVLPYDDDLLIELFNSLGQQLQVLYDGPAYAGLNSISADLTSLADGMYAVRFTFRDNTKMREVVKTGRKK